MAPPPTAAMIGIAARQMRKGASTFTPTDSDQSASMEKKKVEGYF